MRAKYICPGRKQKLHDDGKKFSIVPHTKQGSYNYMKL